MSLKKAGVERHSAAGGKLEENSDLSQLLFALLMGGILYRFRIHQGELALISHESSSADSEKLNKIISLSD